MSTLKLRLDETGLGSIEIDGEELSHRVTGVDLHTDAGRPTRATIHMSALQLALEVDAEILRKPKACYSEHARCWLVPVAGDVFENPDDTAPVEPARVEIKEGQLWITRLEEAKR